GDAGPEPVASTDGAVAAIAGLGEIEIGFDDDLAAMATCAIALQHSGSLLLRLAFHLPALRGEMACVKGSAGLLFLGAVDGLVNLLRRGIDRFLALVEHFAGLFLGGVLHV